MLSLTIAEASFPFDQVLWVHRHLGALATILGCVHASGYLIAWTIERTIVAKLTPSFPWITAWFSLGQSSPSSSSRPPPPPVADNRIFWGLFALLSVLALYVLSTNAVRRRSYRLFYVSHVCLAVSYALGLFLHFHGGTRFLRRIAISVGLLVIDYGWRGYTAWCSCNNNNTVGLSSAALTRPCGAQDHLLQPLVACSFEVFGADVVDDKVSMATPRELHTHLRSPVSPQSTISTDVMRKRRRDVCGRHVCAFRVCVCVRARMHRLLSVLRIQRLGWCLL